MKDFDARRISAQHEDEDYEEAGEGPFEPSNGAVQYDEEDEQALGQDGEGGKLKPEYDDEGEEPRGDEAPVRISKGKARATSKDFDGDGEWLPVDE